MGEAQGRGAMSEIAACDGSLTPLTRLGRRLRFVPMHPPLGKICATLDGVRRLQRLGYREGLYLYRAAGAGIFIEAGETHYSRRSPLPHFREAEYVTEAT